MSTDDFGNDTPHSSPDNLLHDFTPQDDWAREHNTTPRTAGRYRQQGLPWTLWNGQVYIGPKAEARQWLLGRVRRTDAGRTSR
jgi:hypothetical protein